MRRALALLVPILSLQLVACQWHRMKAEVLRDAVRAFRCPPGDIQVEEASDSGSRGSSGRTFLVKGCGCKAEAGCSVRTTVEKLPGPRKVTHPMGGTYEIYEISRESVGCKMADYRMVCPKSLQLNELLKRCRAETSFVCLSELMREWVWEQQQLGGVTSYALEGFHLWGIERFRAELKTRCKNGTSDERDAAGLALLARAGSFGSNTPRAEAELGRWMEPVASQLACWLKVPAGLAKQRLTQRLQALSATWDERLGPAFLCAVTRALPDLGGTVNRYVAARCKELDEQAAREAERARQAKERHQERVISGEILDDAISAARDDIGKWGPLAEIVEERLARGIATRRDAEAVRLFLEKLVFPKGYYLDARLAEERLELIAMNGRGIPEVVRRHLGDLLPKLDELARDALDKQRKGRLSRILSALRGKVLGGFGDSLSTLAALVASGRAPDPRGSLGFHVTRIILKHARLGVSNETDAKAVDLGRRFLLLRDPKAREFGSGFLSFLAGIRNFKLGGPLQGALDEALRSLRHIAAGDPDPGIKAHAARTLQMLTEGPHGK
jgi:hypothetical protein